MNDIRENLKRLETLLYVYSETLPRSISRLADLNVCEAAIAYIDAAEARIENLDSALADAQKEIIVLNGYLGVPSGYR